MSVKLLCLLLVASIASSLASRLGFQSQAEPFHTQPNVKLGAGVVDIATARPARQEDAGIIEYEYVNEELPRRTSYVLEDAAGHMTVVEQQSHAIPGGHVFIQRSTSADGSMAVTTMTSQSSSRQSMADAAAVSAQLEGAQSNAGLMQQLSQSIFAPRSNVMGPLNDLLNVLEAQQQRLSGLLMSRYIESATAAASQQLTQAAAAATGEATSLAKTSAVIGRSSKPCPHHQALVAEMAGEAEAAGYHDEAAWTTEQQAAAEDLAVAPQGRIADFVVQRQHFEQQQPSLLALAASGFTIAQQLHDSEDVADEQQLHAAALGRVEPSDAVSLSGVEGDDVAYDGALSAGPNDDSYNRDDAPLLQDNLSHADSSSIAYNDAELFGDDDMLLPPPGFYNSGSLSTAMDAALDAAYNFWQQLTADGLLLLLLVTCTAVVFVAFARSILQLRQAMAAAACSGASSRGIVTWPVASAIPRPNGHHCQAAAAAALGLQVTAEEVAGAVPQPGATHICSAMSSGDHDDDLTMPLLLDACEGLQEPMPCQRGTPAAAAPAFPAVQRFYNPLFYQRLPGQA